MDNKFIGTGVFVFALLIVLAVGTMIVAGVPRDTSIGIGIAAEAVMLVFLLWMAIKKGVFNAENRDDF